MPASVAVSLNFELSERVCRAIITCEFTATVRVCKHASYSCILRGAKQTGGSSRLSNWNLGSIGPGQPLPSVNAGMDARQNSVPALDEGSLAVPAGFDFGGTGARAMGGGAVSEISGPSSLGGDSLCPVFCKIG